jgi:hypothetical protein
LVLVDVSFHHRFTNTTQIEDVYLINRRWRTTKKLKKKENRKKKKEKHPHIYRRCCEHVPGMECLPRTTIGGRVIIVQQQQQKISRASIVPVFCFLVEMMEMHP